MADFILLVLKISLGVFVFAIGLKATFQDAIFMFRRPAKLMWAFLSMNVIMPIFAVLLVSAFNLHPAVKIAVVALSVSPIPPVLPSKALKAGGRENYALGLLVAASLLAIIWVPLSLELFQRIFGLPLKMSVLSVAGVVLMTVLAPLAVGMAVRAALPDLAEKVARPCSSLAMIILVAGLLPVLFGMREAIGSLIGDGTLAALVAFALVGLFAGHLLGFPKWEDRTVLALYTATRHPGMAIAIAQANFPQQRLSIAAVVLAAIVSGIVSAPYLSWTKSVRATAHAEVPR